ncbi:LysR family transcriptional regulator [Anaerosporobacter sp.]|uniref:LysR family transcriptional regulator n=1 Tax=Anaerosporobacter sp. TaxID=1872529 RepID=UPI00286EDB32|nr:LysR family transcriptional regulator [Anaerosporobacter sp.]
MTLRHLTIFIEVYRTHNMTLAAKKLYMTQPSVSQAIKELELFYEKKLFERLSQKLYITEAGHCLYEYANKILTLYEESITALQSEHIVERLRIGGNYTMGIHMLSDISNAFYKDYPKTELHVTINKTSVIKELLRSNELDLALVEESFAVADHDMIQQPFCKDRIVTVISPNHKLAGHGMVHLSAIADERFLTREKGVGARELFEHIMITNGYPFVPAWESISVTALINECKKNAGIAILPYEAVKEQLAQGELIELPIKNINLSRNLVIMYHKSKCLTPILQNFITSCQEYITKKPDSQAALCS